MTFFDSKKRLLALTEPLYMGLHGRALLRPDVSNFEPFQRDFKLLYPMILRNDVTHLLGWKNWRPRVVGSYVCGFRGWSEFEGCIARLLVRDQLVYASVAYAFALARFASPLSSTALCSYLWNNFSGLCTDYSSISHAIAALRWIDAQNQSGFYERNVGEWHAKIESGRASLTNIPKEEARELMRRAISFERVEECEKQLHALIELAPSL